jgi:hypothetical protein
VDDTIFNLSVLMADQGFAEREKAQKTQFTFFSKGYIDYTSHFAHIEKLLQAAEDHLICLVRYKAAGKSEDREHRFAPNRIVSMNGALYVLGAGVTDNFREIRHLTNMAIHRITDVTLTERQFIFVMPEVEPNTFGLPWQESRTFNICFKAGKAADYVRERIWADNQTLVDTEDGGVLLKLTTRSEPEIMAWVRSFGDEASFC